MNGSLYRPPMPTRTGRPYSDQFDVAAVSAAIAAGERRLSGHIKPTRQLRAVPMRAHRLNSFGAITRGARALWSILRRPRPACKRRRAVCAIRGVLGGACRAQAFAGFDLTGDNVALRVKGRRPSNHRPVFQRRSETPPRIERKPLKKHIKIIHRRGPDRCRSGPRFRRVFTVTSMCYTGFCRGPTWVLKHSSSAQRAREVLRRADDRLDAGACGGPRRRACAQVAAQLLLYVGPGETGLDRGTGDVAEDGFAPTIRLGRNLVFPRQVRPKKTWIIGVDRNPHPCAAQAIERMRIH